MGGRGSASGGGAGGYRGSGVNINAKVGEYSDGSAMRLSDNSSWKTMVDNATDWANSSNKQLSEMGKRQLEVLKKKAKQAVKNKSTDINMTFSDSKYIQNGR